MMDYDIVALGELLIDFTSSGTSIQGNSLFEANPGGAPCNVLAMLAKLGKKTAFIGKVGEDIFGQLLIQTLSECGIDTVGVIKDPAVNTTLAFVKNESNGEREFSFFRKPGADIMLTCEEIPINMIKSTKCFHFGSLSLTHEPARTATKHAVETAKQAGAKVSFDPNLRTLLWQNLDEARRQIAWGCSVCDLLKLSEEELQFIIGEKDIFNAVDGLKSSYPQIRLILVTKGASGAEGFWDGLHFASKAFLQPQTVDTTGAGDTFFGCCLAKILDYGLDFPNEKVLEEMIVFASAAASKIITRKGALRCMPSRLEVQEFINSNTSHRP